MNEVNIKPSYNFIDPNELIVESIEPDNFQLRTQVLKNNGNEYNGYDVDYEEANLDSSMAEQSDFHIGAGVYFDVDKQSEECEKKKKFWFLPFSVERNHTTMINSNLVVSNSGDTGGLFKYEPVSKDTNQELYIQALSEFEDDQLMGNSSKFNMFKQFGDDCDNSKGVSIKVTLPLLVSSIILYYYMY